ncbi:sugar-phosphatase [Sporolactobacillus shoreicorticis]|uniref:Sugar-phosphatase n=1 Tax=Sporolactobacillus shoreicorticis TaxID=1923877 RepID=A0ABW5S7Y1_9BACL|nr:sugar-phosphatase [Sporolactobacillus shoreicorticis]MCO7126554.1 sugar-phosphatase [Sporolactobacillus shoreicorticis]
MIKLIAIDMDGTLLNENKQISERTQHVLKAAKNQGIRIVLCTGRPLLGIKEFLNLLGLTDQGDYAITYNGGLVQHADTGNVISEKVLTRDQLLSIYELSQTLDVPMNFIDLHRVYCPPYPEGKPSMYSQIMKALPFTQTTMEHIPQSFKANKAIFCINQSLLDLAIEKIPKHYFESFTIMKSRPFLLEILNKEVDKGKGLQALGKFLGIAPEEMMTLGDEANDLAMIKYAGLGVAMGNAIEQLKNEAQFVTKTNREDGVAYAIEKFILD